MTRLILFLLTCSIHKYLNYKRDSEEDKGCLLCNFYNYVTFITCLGSCRICRDRHDRDHKAASRRIVQAAVCHLAKRDGMIYNDRIAIN